MAASQWPRCPERVSAGTGAAIHKPRPRHPALAPRYSCCTPHSLAVLLAAARPMARKHARRQPQASGIRADAGRRRASPGGVPCARFRLHDAASIGRHSQASHSGAGSSRATARRGLSPGLAALSLTASYSRPTASPNGTDSYRVPQRRRGQLTRACHVLSPCTSCTLPWQSSSPWTGFLGLPSSKSAPPALPRWLLDHPGSPCYACPLLSNRWGSLD
jgi:hypothetical protein